MSMKEIKAKYLGNIYQTSKDGYDGAIFSPRYISRTLTAKNSGGCLSMKLTVELSLTQWRLVDIEMRAKRWMKKYLSLEFVN